jgi:hypothetical protein
VSALGNAAFALLMELMLPLKLPWLPLGRFCEIRIVEKRLGFD